MILSPIRVSTELDSMYIKRFAPTKGKRSKRQLPNLFTVASSHYQPSSVKPNYLKNQSPHLIRLSFRCDCILGTPPMFIDILAHPDLKKYDLSSLRKGNGFCNLEASFPETLGRRLLNLALG